MAKVEKKYAKYKEQDLVEFVLYKCRSNDMDFIDDFLGGDDFLGPTIRKELNRFYKGYLKFEDLKNDLYIFLSKDNWRCIEQFKGRTGFVVWMRLISRNFFRGLRKTYGINVKINDSFQLDSPYASDWYRKRVISLIPDEQQRKLLNYLYLDRLSEKDCLCLMEDITSMSELNRLCENALKEASRIAAGDEYTRAIFFIENETEGSTIQYQDWMEVYEGNWECEIEREEMKVKVRLIISRWKSKLQRTVIEKRILEGKTTTETAFEMGISEANVYDYLSKGVKRLTKDLKKYKSRL